MSREAHGSAMPRSMHAVYMITRHPLVPIATLRELHDQLRSSVETSSPAAFQDATLRGFYGKGTLPELYPGPLRMEITKRVEKCRRRADHVYRFGPYDADAVHRIIVSRQDIIECTPVCIDHVKRYTPSQFLAYLGHLLTRPWDIVRAHGFCPSTTLPCCIFDAWYPFEVTLLVEISDAVVSRANSTRPEMLRAAQLYSAFTGATFDRVSFGAFTTLRRVLGIDMASEVVSRMRPGIHDYAEPPCDLDDLDEYLAFVHLCVNGGRLADGLEERPRADLSRDAADDDIGVRGL